MDFSENIKANIGASKASDLAYSRWYAQQPDEKKAAMIASGFQFVTENIEYQMNQENPFATRADVIFKFIEVTQKTGYPPETFDFITEEMSARSEKEWQQRFKAMKKALGWSYGDMARFVGAASGASVKASVNRQLPAFAKLAVCVFEQLTKTGSQALREE